MQPFLQLYLLFILFFSISCGNKPSELKFKRVDNAFSGNLLLNGKAPLDFDSLQKYILKPKCIACHSGPDAKPKNDPIDFNTYETTMVNRFIPLLIKGKPEKSRLYKSVLSGEMPISGKLHSIEIEFIKNWIKACAPKIEVIPAPTNCKSDDDDDDDDDFGDDDFNNDEF